MADRVDHIKAPETELGSLSGENDRNSFPGVNWSSFTGGGDDIERVLELQWPNSIATYNSMMNDAQANSLMNGLVLPIRAYRWYIEPNNAPPEAVARIATDYNLPIGKDGEFHRLRGQRRFSFEKHLEDALRALVYGHYAFEQVGEIGEDGQWHLRKLGVRAPRTINEIKVARDGMLEYIKQSVGPNAPSIPINRLVWYAWDREGANWTGRSMLRAIYRNFLVKDRVLRVGAINIERAGGVPFVEAPEGASGDQIRMLDDLARRFRVGEGAGAALPHGAQLKFASAANGDGAVQYIKLQNEEMARGFLEMVTMLGQTNSGSRGLSDNFLTILQIAQYTIAKWFADIFNEHVIEDDVEWNEGPDQLYAPLLKFDGGTQDPMQGFKEADGEDDGLQVEDPEVRAALGLDPAGPSPRPRRRHRAARGGSTVQAANVGGVRAASDLASQVSLPPRPLRRQPTAHEISAAIDYAIVDSTYESALTNLQNEMRMARSFQIDELRDAIAGAGGDLKKLSTIDTSVSASERLQQHLGLVASAAIDQAVQEANRQGVDVPRPSAGEIADQIAARAAAVDELLKDDIIKSARREAIRLTGGGLSPKEVADETHVFLVGLVGAAMSDILGGAVQQSMNAGRKFVYQKDGEDGTIIASELLDSNTCGPCIHVDGTVYESVDDAERDYPTGGYRHCDGRERCRGFVAKVYAHDREPANASA